ncbi:PHD-zinc-finger like domain family protein [Candida albicans]|uniref:PHD-zinc-finger like domain family protein n=1 Tax=Candida albicans TaxID=5476 RepID=A0A8H6F5Q5_CANAX|nr:PHD-zinc-finger like domain family protein [Candida albicans]
MNSVSANSYDFSLKPREETDFKEIYPDLDETCQLPVFVIDRNTNSEESSNLRHAVNLSELKAPTYRRVPQLSLTPTNLRFSKQLSEYGFQNPSKETTASIEKFIEKKKNLVEYDMDEQDYLFLQDRNNQPENVIKITPEVFEIMMTSLENQWCALELKMNSITTNVGSSTSDPGSNHKLLTIGHNNAKYGNDDGIVPGSIYDQKCAICNDSDCDNANAIVFCDGCDIAVHQECYGVAFIPEGQWLCRKCMINKNRTTECVFCPSTTGAFKQLDNSLWSHVICGLWINELYFANPIYMEPIEGMEGIPKSRWKLTCYICKQRVGACIQCCNRSCFQAYHVTCAKRAGLYMSMTQGIKGAISNKLTLKSYCERHSPAEFDETKVLDGIRRTRLYYRDTKLLNEENARLSKDRETANKLNIFKWNTEANTPIAPKLFSDVLPNRTKMEILQDLRSIADEVCRYWCLKRKSKRGASLIRKNNNLIATSSILYDSNSLENNNACESTKKIEFAESLVSDIDRLISMGEMLTDEQEANHEINSLTIMRLNNKFDFNETLRTYKPKSDAVISLNSISGKNSQYGYQSIDQLEQDVENLREYIFQENKPSSAVYKKMKNWIAGFRKELPSLQVFEKDVINDGNQKSSLSFPNVRSAGTNTDLKLVDYRTILEENDLSEIDDDEIESVQNQKELEKFLQD